MYMYMGVYATTFEKYKVAKSQKKKKILLFLGVGFENFSR